MERSSVVFFFKFGKLLCVTRSGEKKKEISFTVEKRRFGGRSPEEYW